MPIDRDGGVSAIEVERLRLIAEYLFQAATARQMTTIGRLGNYALMAGGRPTCLLARHLPCMMTAESRSVCLISIVFRMYRARDDTAATN